MGQCIPKKARTEESVTFKEFCSEQETDLYEWNSVKVDDKDVDNSVFMIGTIRLYV